MNAVATPTRPKAKKKATPSIARQQDNSKILAPTDHGVEPNFMQGKAIPGIGEVPVQIFQALPYVLTCILLAGFIGVARPPKAGGVAYTKER